LVLINVPNGKNGKRDLKELFFGLRFVIALLVLLSIAFLLISCVSSSGYSHVYYLTTMDTVVELRFNLPDDRRADEVKEAVFNEIKRLEKLFSRTVKGSEVNLINQFAGIKQVPVSPETLVLIEKTLYYSEISEGAFDPTTGPLINLWGFLGQEYRLPSDAEINRILPLVDYEKLIIDQVRSAVLLPDKAMALDLGGIAKGFIVDRAVNLLELFGVKEAYINAGGDLALVGCKTDGERWRIGIRHPRDEDKIIAVIEVAGGAVVTSGDYQRYFKRGGIAYHHIIDPSTGWPARALISVTVIAETVSEADALSTAVFVLGPQKGLSLIEELAGTEGVLITPELEIICSSGLDGMVEIQ
jgi:FAD:protein FMN transferase